jgi:hypothetical protein
MTRKISARSVKDLEEADRLLRGDGPSLAGAPYPSAFGCYQRYREVCDLVAKVLRRVTK